MPPPPGSESQAELVGYAGLDGQYHGRDVLNGGDGNDTIEGNGNDDQLAGGNDDDELHGDDGITPGAWQGNDTIYGNGNNDSVDGVPQRHPTAFGFRRRPLRRPETPAPNGSPIIPITLSLYAFRPIDEHNISGYTARQFEQAAATGGQTIVRPTGLRVVLPREMTCRAGMAGNDGVWAVAA